MTLRSESISLSALLSALILLACSPTPRFYLQYGQQFTQSDLDRILAENPLAPTENIRVATLGRTKEVSHHVVQVRDREVPHIHKVHDLMVVMLRGQGHLILEGRRIELSVGDVLFVPRGVVHYFVNTDSQPSVAFVAYSPPFDGKDTIPVDKP